MVLGGGLDLCCWCVRSLMVTYGDFFRENDYPTSESQGEFLPDIFDKVLIKINRN